MMKLLAVGVGGFLGAVARYGLSGLVHRWYAGSFPFGTLAVNVVGCLAIGAAVHLLIDRSLGGPNVRLFVTIGILGGFTTFSTFGYETLELLRERAFAPAALNVAGNVVLGLAAVWLGRALMKALGV